MTFYWLTPFVNSDWLDLVIYFHTNELVNKTFSWSTFKQQRSTTRFLRQVCATFGIETFQEEQQKATEMFFEGNDVFVSLPTGYGKSLIYQAAPVIDRLSSLDESGHYIYCAAR